MIDQANESFPKRYYLIFLSTVLGPLSTNSLVPIFEQLRLWFGLSSIALVTLAVSFYIFPFAILQLFAGTYSDIVDKKKVVIIGYLIFLFALFLNLTAVLIKNYSLFLIAINSPNKDPNIDMNPIPKNINKIKFSEFNVIDNISTMF